MHLKKTKSRRVEQGQEKIAMRYKKKFQQNACKAEPQRSKVAFFPTFKCYKAHSLLISKTAHYIFNFSKMINRGKTVTMSRHYYLFPETKVRALLSRFR